MVRRRGTGDGEDTERFRGEAFLPWDLLIITRWPCGCSGEARNLGNGIFVSITCLIKTRDGAGTDADR